MQTESSAALKYLATVVKYIFLKKNHKTVYGQLKSEKTFYHKEKRILVFVSLVGTSHYVGNSSAFFFRQSIKRE